MVAPSINAITFFDNKSSGLSVPNGTWAFFSDSASPGGGNDIANQINNNYLDPDGNNGRVNRLGTRANGTPTVTWGEARFTFTSSQNFTNKLTYHQVKATNINFSSAITYIFYTSISDYIEFLFYDPANAVPENVIPENISILDPSDTNTYSTAGTFDVTNVTAIAWRAYPTSSGASVFVRNRSMHIVDKETGGLVLVNGDAITPGKFSTFDNEEVIQNIYFAEPKGSTQHFYRHQLVIGDGVTPTRFEESNFSLELSKNQDDVADNEIPYWASRWTSGFGLYFSLSASDYIRLSDGQLTIASPWPYRWNTVAGADVLIQDVAISGAIATITPEAVHRRCNFPDSNGFSLVGVAEATDCNITSALTSGAAVSIDNNSANIDNTIIALSSTADYHLELDTSVTAITLNGVTFSGTPTIDKIHVLRTTGTVTITVDAVTNLVLADVTSEGATVNVVAPSVGVTISPLLATSRLKIYDTGTTTLIDGVNSSGISFAFESGVVSQGYDIYIVLPGRESIFIENYIFPASSTTLPVEQISDINYFATSGYAIDSSGGAGLGATTDFWPDTGNKEIQLATGVNLSQPTGIPLQDLYSLFVEARYADDALMPYHDPVVAISATAGEFELRRGWSLKDNTTRDLLRSGGLAQYSDADVLEIEYLGLEGLLNLASAATPYYWFGSATNPTIVNTLNAGNLNQLVQVYGDASNGNFDFRTGTELTISVRAQGENIATYALKSEQSLTDLNPQRYFIPLVTTANANITVIDTAIDANSDGTADVAPYGSMSLTTLESAFVADWANSTVYAAFDRVENASSPGDFYITVDGGTSSGTNPTDDVGVVWYQLDAVYDANNGDLSQMTAYLFWLQRQNVDIDSSSVNQTGRSVPSLATTRGSTLVLRPGLWAINFNTSAQLTHIPVEVDGTERPYPAPPATYIASNFADGTRYQLSYIQSFEIQSADINIGTEQVTLGNDTQGNAAAPSVATAGFHSLIRIELADGATMPSTTPQIIDRGLYRVRTESSGVITISSEEGGAAFTFEDDGTESGGKVLDLTLVNDIAHGVVSGGGGLSTVLSLPNGAIVDRKAILYTEPSGETLTTEPEQERFVWNTTVGVTDIEEISLTNNAVLWEVVNRIAETSVIVLNETVTNNLGSSFDSISPASAGSTVPGLTYALEEGTGMIQINANDADGVVSAHDLALWSAYIFSTEQGLWLGSLDVFNTITFFNFEATNLQIDNLSSDQLKIVGAYIRGLDVSPATTGSVALNVATQGNGAQIETGVSGLTGAESTALLNTDTRTARVDALIEDSGGDQFTAKALSQAPSGGSAPSAADIRIEIDANSTQLAAIVADTNELQTDWADGGRLDAILDARSTFNPASDTVANVTTVGNVTGSVGSISGVAFPSNFGVFAINGSGEVTAENMRGTDGALTALPSIPTDWITAAGIAADAIVEIQSGLSTFNNATDQVIVITNNDKAGYSLTQAFPPNFAILAIDGSGQVTTGTMGGTVTVGGYAAGQAPNDLIDISNLALEATAQSCLSAATAVADGRSVKNFANSTYTLYNTNGSVRTAFDLLQSDGSTAATSDAEVFERRPQ